MKKVGKIVLTVFSILSFLCIFFFVGVLFVGGLSHLYYGQGVVNSIYVFLLVALFVFVLLIAAIVLMFKGKEKIRGICTFLVIVFIPIALYGSYVGAISLMVLGPYGCSYTEDIANYGKYDDDRDNPRCFPEAITEDMTVVDFRYFYKYVDTTHTDFYLEVKFENKETMDKYLTVGKNALSENGTVSRQNPYDPKYTDVFGKRDDSSSNQGRYALSSIGFGGDDDYKYVEMSYYAITYSYDDLTIIYTYTNVGGDIEVGTDPDKGAYYPKFLERFGVEWDPAGDYYVYDEE